MQNAALVRLIALMLRLEGSPRLGRRTSMVEGVGVCAQRRTAARRAAEPAKACEDGRDVWYIMNSGRGRLDYPFRTKSSAIFSWDPRSSLCEM